MEDQNNKNLYLTVFGFLKILRMREKNITKSANFFVIFLYCKKRRCSHIEPQAQVKKEVGREAL